MSWVADNVDLIWALTLDHLRQSAIAIIAGFVLSVPLGWLAFRYTRLRGTVLTVVGLLYTIPSFALFAVLTLFGIPFLSELNLLVALTIYAVAIMTRSVTDGLASVDPIVRRELQTETLRLQKELDKTIVFVTHDIDEAFLLGDQVVILEKGARIAQIGSPSEIIENPASDFVADFIGVERGTRALRAKRTARGTVLVDDAGRTQGVLVEDEP